MIPLEECKPNWTAIGVIGGFVINISGWFIAHYLTKKREDRRERQITTQNFLGFLRRWRSEIANAPTISAGTDWGGQQVLLHPCLTPYRNGLPNFESEIGRVRDFINKPGFILLTQRLVNLEQEDWNKQFPCTAILEAMDELIAFVESEKS
jgi:hypothetical protein